MSTSSLHNYQAIVLSASNVTNQLRNNDTKSFFSAEFKYTISVCKAGCKDGGLRGGEDGGLRREEGG